MIGGSLDSPTPRRAARLNFSAILSLGQLHSDRDEGISDENRKEFQMRWGFVISALIPLGPLCYAGQIYEGSWFYGLLLWCLVVALISACLPHGSLVSDEQRLAHQGDAISEAIPETGKAIRGNPDPTQPTVDDWGGMINEWQHRRENSKA